MPWSRARVRSEAGSLKIPQDQLIHSEPMRDKKTLRVTDATEANTKFKIHGLQTAVKDTVRYISSTRFHRSSSPPSSLPILCQDKSAIISFKCPSSTFGSIF